MEKLAFQASYSDWKVIKGRKVVQLVFELPLEKADEAYQVLGGMPIAAHEVWCGIARMNVKGGDASAGNIPEPSTTETQPRSSAAQKAGAEKSPAQVAGYLCTVGAFQRFLEEKYPEDWDAVAYNTDGFGSDLAAECVRRLCDVKSRSELTDKNVEWTSLRLAYQLWLNEPDLDIVA